MHSVGSAMAVLLGAAASARRGRLDATGVKVVHQALSAVVEDGLRLEVRSAGLRGRGVEVDDPEGEGGLSGRLARAGAVTMLWSAPLDPAAIAALLDWAAREDGAPLPAVGGGLRIERAGAPAPADLVRSLARDPESGLDLITLMDGGGATGPERASTQIAEVTERLRRRLGRARLAAVESELRRSLGTEALRAARVEIEATVVDASGAALPELPADALVVLPED